MSRLSFDQVAALAVGDIFYECEMGFNIEARVLTPVVVTVDSGKRKLAWNAANTKNGTPLPYLLTEGFTHYGPRLYDAPEYYTVVDGEAIALFHGDD